MMKLKLNRMGVFAVLAVLASACGVIPEAYQGKYRDPNKGAEIELLASGGKFEGGGRKFEVAAKNLEVDDLLEAKPGIYVSPEPDEKKYFDVYWIQPRPETRKEVAQFVWYESELFFTKVDSVQKDKVKTLLVFHCLDGQVLLDKPSQTWQMGCPAHPTLYEFQRIP